MNVNYPSNVNYLDSIRINEEEEFLKSTFNDLLKNNKAKALQLLSQDNLSFPCLFLLLPQINEFNLFDKLSYKNQYAAKVCENSKMRFHNNLAHYTLKWIFITGAKEENLNSNFDEVIDKSATQLLIVYNDKTILPMIAELIFRRHVQGKYIHDLVWCLFQSKDPQTIPLISKYIRSHKDCDNELAYKLLNFKPELQPNDKEQQYHNFNTWLNENRNFLYSTGENMQQTSNPKYFRVNLTAKYLCNGLIANKASIPPFTSEQRKRINEFESMQHCDQKMLAKYSFRTYKNDLQWWNSWMKAPITAQISIAKAELGEIK